MILQLNDKLNSLFNYLTKKHNLEISDLDVFKRYIYQIDAIRIKIIVTPFIWEDYIFIDNYDLYKLDRSGYERRISEMDKNIIDFVVTKDEKLLRSKYFNDEKDDETSEFFKDVKLIMERTPYRKDLTIDHLDFVHPTNIPYYKEQCENHFIFRYDKYQKELLQRRRDLKLKELIR